MLMLLLSILMVGNAQKLSNGKRVRVAYTQNPTDQSIQSLKTYFVDFKGYVKDRARMEKNAVMPGYDVMGTSENADFLIEVLQSNFNCSAPAYKKDTHKSKNKDGTYTTTYSYTYKSTITATYSVKLMLQDGTVLSSELGTVSDSWITSSKSTAASAREYYTANIDKEKNAIALKAFNKAFQNIQEKYCFVQKWVYSSFVSFKYKKHDYEELNNVSAEVNKLLVQVVNESDIEKVLGYINVFEKDLANYDAEDKKARINTKVKGGILYNIGLGYFYLGDFENALKYLKLATEIDKKVQNYQQIMVSACERNIEFPKGS